MNDDGNFSSQRLNVKDVDVVVADDEAICRLSAVQALTRFGFCSVHEVESGDEVLEKLTELQDTAMPQARTAPVIILMDPVSIGSQCARQISTLLAQRSFVRKPFLVRMSVRRIREVGPSNFHCEIAKQFEASSLAYCFDLCQEWWIAGGGEPMMRPQASPSSASRTLGKDIYDVAAKAVTASSLPVMTFSQQQLDWMPPSALASLTEKAMLKSNNAENLKTPFEDILLICLIGRGAYGRVYRARWNVTTVALKVVEHVCSSPDDARLEAALSTSLMHPNLVQAFKWAIKEQKPKPMEFMPTAPAASRRTYELWIAQEWCGLGTLDQKIRRKEMLSDGSYDEAMEVATEIACAVSYLHSLKIIHGDLSTSNVLLAEKRCPKGYITKVADFGLSRVLEEGRDWVSTVSIGTVNYMPPEIFLLRGFQLTKKVDVWAFGVILWQLCAGEKPYGDITPQQVIVLLAKGSRLCMPKEVPAHLTTLFERCCAKDPHKRLSVDLILAHLMERVNVEPPLASEQDPAQKLLLTLKGDGQPL